MTVTFTIDANEVPWPVGLSFVGQYMGTNARCFDLISKFLKEYPAITTIVEIGTLEGAMTLYLSLWADRLGVPMHTFDIEPEVSRDVHHVFAKREIVTHWVDAFSREGLRQVAECFKDGPGLIFMDGGDKNREFATIAPLLPTGSLIAVHDWGTEFTRIDGGIAKLYYRGDEWMKNEARLAMLRKIGNAEDMTQQMSEREIAAIKRRWIELVGH